MGGQRHDPAALPPGKSRYPLYTRLGGPQGQSGRVRKNLAPTGIRFPDRPARSEWLYRLSYPGPQRRRYIHTNNCHGQARFATINDVNIIGVTKLAKFICTNIFFVLKSACNYSRIHGRKSSTHSYVCISLFSLKFAV